MFDIGWLEMFVVAVIAIVFVGPKELPGMLRTFGRAIKKVRSLAGEFQGQVNEALKEAELDGVKDTFNDMRSLDPTKAIKDKLNPLKDDLERPVEPAADKSPKEIVEEIEKDHAAYKAEQRAKVEQGFKEAEERAKAGQGAQSGTNAVPGFSSAPADVPVTEEMTPAAQMKEIVAEAGAAPAGSGNGVKTSKRKTAKSKPKAAQNSSAKPKATAKAKTK